MEPNTLHAPHACYPPTPRATLQHVRVQRHPTLQLPPRCALPLQRLTPGPYLQLWKHAKVTGAGLRPCTPHKAKVKAASVLPQELMMNSWTAITKTAPLFLTQGAAKRHVVKDGDMQAGGCMNRSQAGVTRRCPNSNLQTGGTRPCLELSSGRHHDCPAAVKTHSTHTQAKESSLGSAVPHDEGNSRSGSMQLGGHTLPSRTRNPPPPRAGVGNHSA
jgi:hypothetical protein